MKVMYYEIGKEPVVKEIAYDLTQMQKLVGGYVETVPLTSTLTLICNEDGKLKGLPLNKIALLYRDNGIFLESIAGNFFVCRKNKRDFASLTDTDVELLRSGGMFK